MAKIEQLEPTTYLGNINSTDTRQANRLIILANGEMYEYDLSLFDKDRLYFGCDEANCDITIPAGNVVSPVHGKIKMTGSDMYIADMGSTTGTWILENNTYIRMDAKRYYHKNAADMILRIESPDHNTGASVAMIFTNSENKSAWKCVPLQDGITTIGRDPRNTIALDSSSFSRKHAAIKKEYGQYMIADYGSTNGVYVNGERVMGSCQVGEKDLIQIANSLFFILNGQLLYQNAMNGISLSMQNVDKIVGSGRNRKKILDRVFCDIGSNEFVAIIGGSGAGKTTVMNAMSGFDSEITGKIFCNGIDLQKNFNTMKNMIGFVPQQDIIYENLTLKKMLYYTAKMKMPPDTSKSEMLLRITKVLQMVDLEEHAQTYIRKLSGGQKKRASIAVEMLADPGLFFLDEPTSGLDPDTEQSLMHTLAKLSKTEGKTIIMVTHTTQSIHLCDKVIFMGPGGKICYCGAPSEITFYFGKKDLVEVYDELAGNVDSWNRLYLQNYIEEYRQKAQTPQERPTPKKAAKQVSAIKQLGVLTARYFELIWNDKQRLTLLLMQPLLIALLLKVVAKSETFKVFGATQSIMFALSCSGIWIGLFNTIQEICKERPILKREYMGNLRLWTYIISKYIVQGVICLTQATILTTVFLCLMKHAPKKALFMPTPQLEIWVTMFLTIYASAAMGLIVSAVVRNGDRAMAIAPFVLIIQLLFSGVLFELKGMSKKISLVTVSRWAMEGLGNITNLNALDSGIPNQPVQHNDFYNRGLGHLAHTWEILGVVAVICGIISVIMLHNLKKDRR